MGKYIKKGKIAGEVAVMEVAHQSSLGVRTRARTLALQRLQRSSSPTPSPSPAAENDDGSYLQLRSRRLEKAFALAGKTKEKDSVKDGCKPANTTKTAADPAIFSGITANSGCAKNSTRRWEELEADGSSGENAVESESDESGARETTPCSSFTRDSDATCTPGSTTRRMATPDSRRRAARRCAPSSFDMDDFFAAAERLQQKAFLDKYNFDPVNDCPLPGRYEWVRLDP